MAGSDTAMQSVTAEEQLFPWWLFLLWGLLTLLIGLSFLFTPGITTELFILFLAAYWVVGGVFIVGSLFIDRTNTGMKVLLAVINIFAGVLILSHPLYSTIFALSFLVLFLGFWACFIGSVHLYHAIGAKDAGNGVLGVISLVFGILLLAHPFFAVVLVPFVAGGFCLVSGFSTLYVAFIVKKAA
ncbi:MAG: DUF308 domain-containing protein [Methanoregula sp.]|nr:DUF308 domain-containing protein [Methanoregula sp.]